MQGMDKIAVLDDVSWSVMCPYDPTVGMFVKIAAAILGKDERCSLDIV
jgi:hypothetical protein